MTHPADRENNRRTVAAYDAYASEYAAITQTRLAIGEEALTRFGDALAPGGRVLEVASGPGWDADDLEARGFVVHRTDLSEGFIALQAERGRTVHRLDLAADDLGGPWDGLVALYVLQHMARGRLDDVLARMARALRPGGLLLTSFQEGDADCEQEGSDGGVYHVVQRRPETVLERLAYHGLDLVWSHSFQGSEARWTILIARRP